MRKLDHMPAVLEAILVRICSVIRPGTRRTRRLAVTGMGAKCSQYPAFVTVLGVAISEEFRDTISASESPFRYFAIPFQLLPSHFFLS
jgi:hypothetical protein